MRLNLMFQDLLKVDGLERELRALSFGYRAAYIANAVTFLSKQEPNGTAWLLGLRKVPYEEAKQSLLQIPGIGPKVRCLNNFFEKQRRKIFIQVAF